MLQDRQFRVARLWSNQELRRFAPLMEGEIVNVSAGEDVDKEGGKYADYFTKKSSYYMTNHKAGSYRGFQGRQNEYLIDLTEDLPSELNRRFDVAFNHTTMEHIFEVRKAFANLCAMSRDVVITVVPFCQVQHEFTDFGDYWRFTPSCMRQLFRENGLEVVYESANNNYNAAVYVFNVAVRDAAKWKGKFPEYKQLAEAGDWVGRSLARRSLTSCMKLLGLGRNKPSTRVRE